MTTDDGSSESPNRTTATPSGETPPSNVLILPASAERELAESDESLGVLGRPFDRRAPFFVGFTGALGVAVAYAFARGFGDITSVLVIIGLALFVAIGLNPILEFCIDHGIRRGIAVVIVTIGFVLAVVAFVLAAVSPISHEVNSLVKDYPRYKANLASGKGWGGQLVAKLHLTSYFKGKPKLKIPVGGVLGAGKLLLSLGIATTSVIALTIYFLIALPGVKRLWLSFIPRSRRERVGLLTDEVFSRVGGFMLGNLVTSLISGVGTFIWLLIFGIRYALLLAVIVALFDLIPMVGSTIAGVIVSLFAFSKGIAVGIATSAFYIIYRYLEDYLLNPRVMKHTVKVTPGLTIIATLIGGTLLGLIGALVAIPVAATLHLLLEEVTFPRQNQR
ncbi:MAG TPA: AI-2E family transporter [Acidimicrobiales bacterium]|nr:AI-2E family transporter [Acidimicrobiales bacterium]